MLDHTRRRPAAVSISLCLSLSLSLSLSLTLSIYLSIYLSLSHEFPYAPTPLENILSETIFLQHSSILYHALVSAFLRPAHCDHLHHDNQTHLPRAVHPHNTKMPSATISKISLQRSCASAGRCSLSMRSRGGQDPSR